MNTQFFKTTIAGVLFAVLSLNALAADEVRIDGAEVGRWTMDFEAAVKKAVEKKLPLMLNFTGSDWCGWCKLMDEQIFAQDVWNEFAKENVFLVTIDFPEDKSIVPEKYAARNDKLREEFEVRGYPTYIVLDSDGKTKLGQLGAGRDKTPASFVEEFKNVVRLSESNIEAYVKANPEKAEAFMAAIAEDRAAKKDFADWLATKPVRNEENTRKFEAFQTRLKEAAEELTAF
ncbi:MAG: thioredoxin family protein [Verrucomicrobiota bacterium]